MRYLFSALTGCFALFVFSGVALADQGIEDRVAALEAQVRQLMGELQSAKAELAEAKSGSQSSDAGEIRRLSADDEELKSKETSSVLDKFSFGGYGEMHANFTEGGGGDSFDLHRMVFKLGYDFDDWIKLNSEIELEHAFVSGESGGELLIEQLYVDFLLNKWANVRVGRMLAPMGIINQKHEPPAFNGVERPSFDRFIIPTTWSVDGVGLFGSLPGNIGYQAYAVAGLDGSGFSATGGIRGGRIEEIPSLNDIAFTGRLDYFPLVNSSVPFGQDLRLGASFYYGGTNNGNEGDNPGVDGSVAIYSGDMQVSIGDVDLKGVAAYTEIDGTDIPSGVARGILGYSVEAGYHFWPESFKTGRLSRSDAVVFARFDDFDTQFRMPSGVAKDPAGDRQEWTFGLNFYPIPNLVLKADYQIRDSKAPGKLDNLFNFGIGWQL